MTVFEPVTQLCPTALRQIDQSLSFTRQVTQLTDMLIRVYAVTTAPADFEFPEHTIPKVWFGIVSDERNSRSPAGFCESMEAEQCCVATTGGRANGIPSRSLHIPGCSIKSCRWHCRYCCQSKLNSCPPRNLPTLINAVTGQVEMCGNRIPAANQLCSRIKRIFYFVS